MYRTLARSRPRDSTSEQLRVSFWSQVVSLLACARRWVFKGQAAPAYVVNLLSTLSKNVAKHSCSVDTVMTFDQFAGASADISDIKTHCFDVIDGLLDFARIVRDCVVAQATAQSRADFRAKAWRLSGAMAPQIARTCR